MPKLHSSAEIVRTLERNGFTFVSQRGSHMKFVYDGRTVIVPANRREIPMGTLRSIILTSEERVDEYSRTQRPSRSQTIGQYPVVFATGTYIRQSGLSENDFSFS